MSYEPYNPDIAPTEDRIAWVLCQIIDDDAPMRWTRYRGAVENIVLNPSLMLDLQTLARRRGTTRAEIESQRASVRPEELRALVKGLATGKIIPPEATPTIRTRDIYFGHGHATPPGGYKREAIQDPLVPHHDHRGDRIATQKFAVFNVLIEFTNRGLSPSLIEQVRDKLVHEMTEGPTAWAFK